VKPITLDELTEEFAALNPEERMQLVMDFGRQLEPMPAELRTEEHRVQGCQSRLWLVVGFEPGPPRTVRLVADSDSQIVRGLVAIVAMLCSGRTPREVAALDLEGTFERLGLKKYLSPNRANGFYATVRRIRDWVKLYEAAAR
jgi:cysteine desulfuration protein SufE